MNQKKLNSLIILSTISILCLIGIQLYWIKTSVETQQKKFDQSVMEAMQEVIKKLENEEAITKITSTLHNGEELISLFGEDSVLNINEGKLKDEFDNKGLLEETTNLVKTHSDQLRIEFKPPPTNDSSFFIIRETRKNVLSSSISSPEDPNDSLMLQKRISLFNNLVNEIALISISRNFEDKISYEKIDSLFSQELKAKGIKTEYVFDIYDSQTQSLSFSVDQNESSELKNTPYQIRLFPNSFIESDSLMVYFPNQTNFVLKNSWKVLITSFLLVCILIFLFYSSISTIYKQKKLSLIKNDFINNMTHELKTPISTISLACEVLNDQSIEIDKIQRSSYVKMINDENKRLSVLVDNVLKSAVWDSSELQLSKGQQNLHPLIIKIAKSFEIQVNKRGGSITLSLDAENDLVMIDKVHLSNVLYNLLDNANKYSPGIPEIEILTKNEKGKIVCIVSDKGLGISKEDQKKVFEKFYRVSTGNIHDVKGFGLGLSYVKRIIELHNGEIEIDSLKTKGTKIIIKLNTHGN